MPRRPRTRFRLLLPFPVLVVVLLLLAGGLAVPGAAQMRGTLRQITQTGAGLEDLAPTISDDGGVVAWFRTGQGRTYDLYVAFAPNYVPRALVTAAVQLPVWPEVSGDGTTVAYTDGTDVFVVPAAGGTPKNVTNFTTGQAVELFTDLTIAHDGRKVCFVSTKNGITDATVVDTTTSAITNVSNNTTSDIVVAAISGDAKTVVFSAKRGGASEALWSWSGGTVRKVIDIAPDLPDMLELDRAGKICAYESVGSGGTEVWVVRTTGASNRNVSQNPGGADRRVAIASNGDRITWKSARTNQNTQADVWMVMPEGTNARNITMVGDMNPSILNTDHALNGDGTRVVFSTRKDLLNGNPETDADLYLWTDALSQIGRATPGRAVSLLLHEPTAAGEPFLVRTAFSRIPGIPVPGVGTVPLTPDPLFLLSGRLPAVFVNYGGALSATGRGSAAIVLPGFPGLIGLDLYSAFIAVGARVRISNSLKTEIR